MSQPKIYVDGILLNWGDRLFYEPVRMRGAPRMVRVRWPGSANELRAQISRTVRRVPEVMIKITNRPGSSNGMGAIRHHLAYISRNGKIELEDHNGERIDGRHEVSDLTHVWSLAGRGIAEESTRREAFNIMLSMPPGTDRQAVRDAAREFARHEFSENFDYVFAAHDDEAHPHVHLVILARGRNGKRLNPRKADLQRWRERFAHELRERGVEANATPRRTRGETRRCESQASVHMRERGEISRESRSVDSYRENAQVALAAHMPTLAAWRSIAEVLAGSAEATDRRAGIEITDFVNAMPVVTESRARREPAPEPSGTSSGIHIPRRIHELDALARRRRDAPGAQR